MKKFFIVTIIIVIAGLTILLGFYNKDSAKTNPNEPANEDISKETVESLLPIEPDAVFQEPITYSRLNQAYSHSDFSFKYSDGFTVLKSDLNSGGLTSVDGEIITVENPKGSGFQIFISSFDEPGPITPERIWQDQPDMEITDPKNAQLDGAKALVFNSYDGDLGETFEVWTVYPVRDREGSQRDPVSNGVRSSKLYQITGPKTAEKLIIETLETWRWR